MLVTNMGSSSVPSYSHSLIRGRAQNTPSQALSLSAPGALPTTGAEDKPVLCDQAREGCQWPTG